MTRYYCDICDELLVPAWINSVELLPDRASELGRSVLQATVIVTWYAPGIAGGIAAQLCPKHTIEALEKLLVEARRDVKT